MNAEAILEAVKAYAKTRIEIEDFPYDYERGERDVAQDILKIIKGLERKKDERKESA